MNATASHNHRAACGADGFDGIGQFLLGRYWRTASEAEQQAYLKAANPDSQDRFGSTVAIEGVQSGNPASPVTMSTTFNTAHEVAA